MLRAALLLATCLCAAGVHAQRAAASPEGFLDDVKSAAAAGRLGGALLGLDAQRKAWGDYCNDSQELARRGEFREAVRAATKALHLGQSQHGNRGAPIIYASHDLATAYNYAGDQKLAQYWADRTLDAIAGGYDSRVHAEVSRMRANAHRIRALALSHRGDHAGALAEMAKALDALPTFGAGSAKSELEVTQGNLLLRAGRIDEAAALAARLLREGDASFRNVVARLAGEAALARKDAAAALGHFDTAAAAATARDDRFQLALSQLGRARALRARGDLDEAGRQLDDVLASLERVRSGFRSSEMRTALFGNLQSVFDEAVAFHAERGDAQRAFAASEASRARAMLDLQGKVEGPARAPVGRPRALADIQSQLGAGRELVAYHQLPSQLVAWKVGATSIQMKLLPLAAARVHADVEAWRRALESPSGDALKTGQAMHAAILAPLGISPGTQLVFVPHRSLHLAPFQALHDGSGWLVERHAVATALSASLLEAQAFAPGTASLAAVGNPDLGRADWALPGAEREVNELAKLYTGAKVVVRADATKAQLAGIAPGADVVHVAAHAVVDEIDPMYSVIKLANPAAVLASMRTDLQARELAAMDLSRARLLTLSACNSGVGTVAQGDEFMGFKRAIFAAGARSALVSLWAVDDESTEVLMTSFHGAWQKGSRIDALRAAQLATLRKPGYGHPYYWAAFTLVGDPG